MQLTLQLIKEFSPYLSLIFSAFIYFKTQNNKAAKEGKTEFKKLQVTVENHTLMHQSHQNEREKLVDGYNMRMQHIENQLNSFGNIIPEVQTLKIKLESFSVKIEAMSERIREMNADSKESTARIIDLIKDGNKKN